ncbi:unnamed protein product, partial [Trichogramma brassicae]
MKKRTRSCANRSIVQSQLELLRRRYCARDASIDESCARTNFSQDLHPSIVATIVLPWLHRVAYVVSTFGPRLGGARSAQRPVRQSAAPRERNASSAARPERQRAISTGRQWRHAANGLAASVQRL